MAQREPSAAQALYGHLKSGAPEIIERRQQPSSVAAAMFPSLVPKPPPPAPRPRMSPEEARYFWANVDESWARSIGLVKVDRK